MRGQPDDPRAVRVYARLLRCHPPAFRQRFGPDMARAFAAEYADFRARGVVTRALFWIRTVLDAVRFGLVERTRGARAPRRQRWQAELRWAGEGCSRAASRRASAWRCSQSRSAPTASSFPSLTRSP